MPYGSGFKSIVILGLGIAITGCQPKDARDSSAAGTDLPLIAADINPDDADEWTMTCANGQSLFVAFDHGRQMITVRRSDGLAFDLIRKTVSSGYLFSSSPVELRGNGKTAQWNAPPVTETSCHVTGVSPRNQPSA